MVNKGSNERCNVNISKFEVKNMQDLGVEI